MTSWSVKDTCEHVRARFGEEQGRLVAECATSIVDRQQFARYHYHQANELLSAHMDVALAKRSVLAVILSNSDELVDTLGAVGANVIGCVQSIHSVADILAHTIYFAMGLNLNVGPVPENQVSIYRLPKELDRLRRAPLLSRRLRDLSSQGRFDHLAALTNRSKHHSLVRVGLWGDGTGKRTVPYWLRFDPFRFGGRDYPDEEVAPFLQGEYDRIALAVVEIGRDLNEVLRSESGV